VSKRAHAGFNGFHKAQNGVATFVMGDVSLDLKTWPDVAKCVCEFCVPQVSLYFVIRGNRDLVLWCLIRNVTLRFGLETCGTQQKQIRHT